MNDSTITPQPTITPPKKDNSWIIVLVIVGVMICLPFLIIAFVFSMIFRFAGEFINEIDLDDWDVDEEWSWVDDSDVMNDGQLASARTLWALSNNALIESAKVSQKDCRNMSFIAGGDSNKWFDPSFCTGESIQVGADYSTKNEVYQLYLSDGKHCATYYFDLADGEVFLYNYAPNICVAEMREFPLVDTGEKDSLDFDFGAEADDTSAGPSQKSST